MSVFRTRVILCLVSFSSLMECGLTCPLFFSELISFLYVAQRVKGEGKEKKKMGQFHNLGIRTHLGRFAYEISPGFG